MWHLRLAQRVPNLDLTIYETNAGIGGTWYTNKYPVSQIITASECGVECKVELLKGPHL